MLDIKYLNPPEITYYFYHRFFLFKYYYSQNKATSTNLLLPNQPDYHY